jgi:redox-sensitive bicupin YhaK (pirin superfamily)
MYLFYIFTMVFKTKSMTSKNNRRDFLGKLSFGLVSVFSLPLLAGNSNRTNSKKMTESNPLLKIRPLGFQWETNDPFLFCVHHEDDFPQGNEQLAPVDSMDGRHIGQDFIIKDGYRMYHGTTVPGFPGHPHRGFETITVVRRGLVDHADSTGAAGRYGNGDVQWMTAGKGVQHSEMFPLLKSDERNPLELFQIWLNLPKKSKMVEPHFKMLWSESIPIVEDEEKGTTFEVLTGSYLTHSAPAAPPDSWAATAENDVMILNIHIEAGGEFILQPSKEGINRTLFFYEGNGLKIANTEIPHYHAAEVDPTATLTLKATSEAVKILVLQGKPINEPVVQHGPFVMNTRHEINEAFQEYHRTQFGGWPWERYDMVHDGSLGRFARHSDGSEEFKS